MCNLRYFFLYLDIHLTKNFPGLKKKKLLKCCQTSGNVTVKRPKINYFCALKKRVKRVEMHLNRIVVCKRE